MTKHYLIIFFAVISVSASGVLTPSIGGLLTPESKRDGNGGGSSLDDSSAAPEVAPSYVPTRPTELMNKLSSGCGLSVSARFTRAPHIYSPAMTSVELTFVNHGTNDLNNIRVRSGFDYYSDFIIDKNPRKHTRNWQKTSKIDSRFLSFRRLIRRHPKSILEKEKYTRSCHFWLEK